MNYTVHSVMYLYYFLMSLGSPLSRRMTKAVAPLITFLQIFQMVLGMAVTVAGMIYYLETGTRDSCFVNPTNSRLGMAMYFCYFVLFVILFRELYCSGSAGSKKKSDANNEICGVNVETGDSVGKFMPTDPAEKKKTA